MKEEIPDSDIGSEETSIAVSPELPKLASPPTNNEPPFSSFSSPQKVLIAVLVSATGLISSLSANIYFPALTTVQEDLHTTSELVNITVTVYMIFQGIAPAIWGAMSDSWGRRPVYLYTLAVYIGCCIGCAFAPNFAALLVLRMFQAFGSSSVIAIGAGVISDITLPSERGTFSGYIQSGQILGPVIGPIIGGILSETVSWRWTFWFLVIYGSIIFILLFFFLPETLRLLVGNGSGYANPTPYQWVRRHIGRKHDKETFHGRRPLPNPLKPLLYIIQPDIACLLFYFAIVYSVMYAIMVSISVQFATIYGLDELQIGLCYIGIGVGSVIGAMGTGKIMDRDFDKTAKKYGVEIKAGDVPDDFPLFKARLRSMWIPIALADIIAIMYGWLLYKPVHISGPLVLSFFFGFCVMAIANSNQTLMIDLYPGKGASITASNNLVRCIFGAIATVTVDPGIKGVGIGWFFTILGLILVASNVLMIALLRYGPRWRQNRIDKANAKKERQQGN